MQSIDDLPFPLPLLVYVALPLCVGVAISFWVWRKSREIRNVKIRSGVRAVVCALFFSPTFLLVTSPGLHGAIPIPYFAWGSVWSGIKNNNEEALWLGVVPLVMFAAILYFMFGSSKSK
ncbi:MAG: hypothetical protein HOP33_22380 [Verrucomicrobia bacterium]|nr:hypothetical protein [Verrucomicrobiota bacterium]